MFDALHNDTAALCSRALGPTNVRDSSLDALRILQTLLVEHISAREGFHCVGISLFASMVENVESDRGWKLAVPSLVGNRTVDQVVDLLTADPEAVTVKHASSPIPALPPPAVPDTQRAPQPAPPPGESPHRPQPLQAAATIPTADPAQATGVPETIDGYASRMSFMMGGPPPRSRPPPGDPATAQTGSPVQQPVVHETASRTDSDAEDMRSHVEHMSITLDPFIEHTANKFHEPCTETAGVFTDVETDIKHHTLQIKELQEASRRLAIDPSLLLTNERSNGVHFIMVAWSADVEKNYQRSLTLIERQTRPFFPRKGSLRGRYAAFGFD